MVLHVGIAGQEGLTKDPVESTIQLSDETILSPSDLGSNDDVCLCRGLELQHKLDRLERAVVILSTVVTVCVARFLFA